MELEYTTAGKTTKLATPEFKVDPNIGITFYDKELSTNRTLTWDKVDSFKLSGETTEEDIARSKAYQRMLSDKNPNRRLNTSVFHS